MPFENIAQIKRKFITMDIIYGNISGTKQRFVFEYYKDVVWGGVEVSVEVRGCTHTSMMAKDQPFI